MKHVKDLLNEKGLSLMVVLIAGLVLFTTFSLLKVSTLPSINPDLSRIGINLSPDNTPSPLANNQTSDPTGDNENEGRLTIAGDSLNIDADADIESEGDNPPYIE